MTDSPPRARLDPLDRTHGTEEPRIILQDTCMGIQRDLPPDDAAFDLIQINGDFVDFGESGPNRNDRYTPEAAAKWTQALIDAGYSNLFRKQLLTTHTPQESHEPQRVRQQLDGIARMSFGSPGKPRRR